MAENTLQFAKAVREFAKILPRTVANVEDLKELIRSSGRIGERYRRAATARSKPEFAQGIIACGQEAQTTHYYLQLLDSQGLPDVERQRGHLLNIARELSILFNKILQNAASS